MDYKNLISPLKIRDKVLKNRIVMPPMECRLNTIDGSPTQEMIDYYAKRAQGGTGMIIVENTFIDNLESRSSVASSGLYSDHQIWRKAELAEAIKEYDCVAIIQLSHGGRQANPAATGLECVAPSPIPCQVTQRMPRELTIDEIHRIQNDFVQAAIRAQKAGFDGVEIHGAHGYLLCEFLSPYANHRTDEYGGNYENRARMIKEIVHQTREAVGQHFIIGLRLSVDEWLGEKGLQPDETCRLAHELEEMIDYVNCSAGNYETGAYCQTSSTYDDKGKIVYLAEEMKKHVQIPVIAVGSLDVDSSEQVLNEGKADLVAFGRALICEPNIGNKVKEGRVADIRPCCRANEGCFSGFAKGYPIRCELNPAAGQERKYALYKVQHPKKIVIVGGGCAGLEAARVASLMGHHVVLLEKEDHLGGHLIEAVAPPFKDKTRDAMDWMIRQVYKGTTSVILNADTSEKAIQDLNPDALIIATGSRYTVPPIPGVEYAIYADEALLKPENVHHKVVVIGGGLVGVETAMTLVEEKNCDVTVVEMLADLGGEMDGNAHETMIARLNKDNITAMCQTTVKQIQPDQVICEQDGKEIVIDAQSIVLAVGLTSDMKQKEIYDKIDVNKWIIGDAKKARSIYACTHEAWEAVFQISDESIQD